MCPQSNLIYVISQLRLSFQMNLGCIRLVVNVKILCMCVCSCVCVYVCVEYVMCVCAYVFLQVSAPVEDKV